VKYQKACDDEEERLQSKAKETVSKKECNEKRKKSSGIDVVVSIILA